MEFIDVRNVHRALPEAMELLTAAGIPMPTRGGPCCVLPVPCTTVYREPTERVIFWPERDANPFFHALEALWMMAGRDDVRFLTPFVKRMATFSDDGEKLHGAYGHRWRYPHDQLEKVITLLRDHPRSRRAVVAMWRDGTDLYEHEAMLDIPCNSHIYFWRAQGKDVERLYMTTMARSNDAIWGATGANAVHFSVLQEYMAARIGVGVGCWWQISNNYHAYVDVMKKVAHLWQDWDEPSPYETGEVATYPMVADARSWDSELKSFLNGEKRTYSNSYFTSVALPLWDAHKAYKAGDTEQALAITDAIKASDWRLACREWLLRRQAKEEARS